MIRISAVIFAWLSIVTLLLIVGEALALFLGMFILQRKSAWRTCKNSALLCSDILFSSISLFIFHSADLQPLMGVLWSFLLISHLYRIVEGFMPVQVPFCFNRPLKIINGVKTTRFSGGLI